jgi:hypothetical protein
MAQRVIDAILAANVTQAEVQAAAAEGAAAGEDALYWREDALYWIEHASRDGDDGVRHLVCSASAARVGCWLQLV